MTLEATRIKSGPILHTLKTTKPDTDETHQLTNSNATVLAIDITGTDTQVGIFQNGTLPPSGLFHYDTPPTYPLAMGQLMVAKRKLLQTKKPDAVVVSVAALINENGEQVDQVEDDRLGYLVGKDFGADIKIDVELARSGNMLLLNNCAAGAYTEQRVAAQERRVLKELGHDLRDGDDAYISWSDKLRAGFATTDGYLLSQDLGQLRLKPEGRCICGRKNCTEGMGGNEPIIHRLNLSGVPHYDPESSEPPDPDWEAVSHTLFSGMRVIFDTCSASRLNVARFAFAGPAVKTEPHMIESVTTHLEQIDEIAEAPKVVFALENSPFFGAGLISNEIAQGNHMEVLYDGLEELKKRRSTK